MLNRNIAIWTMAKSIWERKFEACGSIHARIEAAAHVRAERKCEKNNIIFQFDVFG